MPKGRGITRPLHYAPEETRQALVRSALRLFERKGFHATSVQEIAESAGVTKGAFYHHFEAKEDLLHHVHDEFIDYQLEATQRILTEYPTAREQLYHLIRELLISNERYKANLTVFFQERRYLTGKRFSAVKTKRDEFETRFRTVIEHGMASGEFSPGLNPRVVGFGIIGMCAWTYQWFRAGGQLNAVQVAEVFANMVLDGLSNKERAGGQETGSAPTSD